MAMRHRTKEQKRTAAARRLTYSLPTANASFASPTQATAKISKPTGAQSTSDLFDYHPSLIKKDLLKTLLVSLVVLGVELGLYYYL